MTIGYGVPDPYMNGCWQGPFVSCRFNRCFPTFDSWAEFLLFFQVSVSNHKSSILRIVCQKRGEIVIAGGLSFGSKSKVLTTQVLLNLMLSAILIGVIFQARFFWRCLKNSGNGGGRLKKHDWWGNMSLVVVCKRSFQYNFNVLFVKGQFLLKFLEIEPLRGKFTLDFRQFSCVCFFPQCHWWPTHVECKMIYQAGDSQ